MSIACRFRLIRNGVNAKSSGSIAILNFHHVADTPTEETQPEPLQYFHAISHEITIVGIDERAVLALTGFEIDQPYGGVHGDKLTRCALCRYRRRLF
jgi:hypothetical protein